MAALLKTAILMLAVIGASCSWISRKSITSQYYREYGELIVLTRNSPTTYYEGNVGTTVGFEYDLVNEFARDMNVKARFVVVASDEAMMKELESGHAHLAAAGLAVTPAREKKFLFGPSYMNVEEQVVCHRDLKVNSPKKLAGKKILIISSAEYEEKLEELKAKHADISWLKAEDKSVEEILSMVWEKQVDCTVSDSLIVDLNRKHFPELQVAFNLTRNVPIAWVLPKSQKRLMSDLQDWFQKAEKDQRLKNIKDRYFGFVPEYDFYDLSLFAKRIDSLLPRYAKVFKRAADEVKIDWRLLAAVGYQESHWDPEARSPTGVRGLMMLTNVTAEEMGVNDRLDPLQSVLGGSRYIRKTLDRIPSYIDQKERIWFALAAYNVGWSHLADARKLAIDLGKNPNKWDDVKSVLPLLSQPRYYNELKHGYARGYEPVIYVAQIKRYYNLLKVQLK